MRNRTISAALTLRLAALPALWLAALPWQAAQAAIEAGVAWTRVTPPGISVAVGYVTLKNTGDRSRTLLKITTPDAERISLHQSSVNASGVARMWPIARLELQPGEMMKFAPNGRHLMFEGLAAPWRVGMRIPVTMVFEDEDPITVLFEVRPLVVEAGGHDEHAAQHEHH